MKLYSKHLFAALIATSVMASCSRPVAYFQPTAHEQFKTTKAETVAATLVEAVQPAAVNNASVAVEATQPVTPAQQVVQAKKAIDQIDAYVRNDSKLASNKRLAKQMDRVRDLFTTTTPKAVESINVASTRKTSLLERVMLKRVDKKIKNHLSPEKTMAKSLLTIGVIVGIIGLLFIILNVASPLGIIALVVGLALVLVDLLR